jgi:hypothetical protein
MQPTMSDFPKVRCPFIRQTFEVDKESWRKYGKTLQIRSPEVYLVVNRINSDFEWVFEDPETFAIEKLDGTNVKILTENGRLVAVQNRLNVIDPLQIISGKTFLIEGIFQSIGKNYVKGDGEQAGELIGPKLQGNPYKLNTHLWFPFERTLSDLRYRSFHEHARTFENWSNWFKTGLVSRFYSKRASKMGITDTVMAEGIIFYNLKRRSEGKTWMAKLRRNMFDWYYSDFVSIKDYSIEGRDEIEDQEKLD